MDAPYVDIHTHRRHGMAIEMVSVMAGPNLRESAAVSSAALAGTASAERELPSPPFSIGIHPWQVAALDSESTLEALHEVETAPAAAIGEVGLDFSPACEADPERQKEIFEAQLRIASARHLPVVLHCVRAFEETMAILARHNPPAVIFHGFIGSPEQAVRATDKGYYLSMGERSLSSPKTVEALHGTSLENLLLETDDSPAPIAEIYSRVAGILGVNRETLAQTIYKNYERLARKN
ncbi:MAG: TatD family hydrolase [Alistipes sp.]|jgi:TatD DNase family protein|nr:TatD family hydrolase [Alistipes sp.]